MSKLGKSLTHHGPSSQKKEQDLLADLANLHLNFCRDKARQTNHNIKGFEEYDDVELCELASVAHFCKDMSDIIYERNGGKGKSLQGTCAFIACQDLPPTPHIK